MKGPTPGSSLLAIIGTLVVIALAATMIALSLQTAEKQTAVAVQT
jgi:hypothetical protein